MIDFPRCCCLKCQKTLFQVDKNVHAREATSEGRGEGYPTLTSQVSSQPHQHNQTTPKVTINTPNPPPYIYNTFCADYGNFMPGRCFFAPKPLCCLVISSTCTLCPTWTTYVQLDIQLVSVSDKKNVNCVPTSKITSIPKSQVNSVNHKIKCILEEPPPIPCLFQIAASDQPVFCVVHAAALCANVLSFHSSTRSSCMCTARERNDLGRVNL